MLASRRNETFMKTKALFGILTIGLAIQFAAMAQNKFTLSHPLQNGMTLRFRDNETSGGFNVSWTNLTANVYLDTTNQMVRVIGYASGTQDVQQVSYTISRAVAQPFPNPPIQVTGTVTVRLALPTGGLFFDTGYQLLTWNESIGQYTFNGNVLGTIPVVGSFTLVTGGNTYSTNFSYNLNADLGEALTFQQLSTTNYPASLVVSAFGWTGGMFSYSVGVGTAAQVTAADGFPVTIQPGMEMWGLFNGESFNWSFGAQQYLSGGAGVDYTPTSAYPGEAPLLPVITTQPASTVANVGGNATFSVAATGKAPLTYQWLFNGIALVDGGGLNGSASNLLALSIVTTNQAGNYSVIVTNGYGASVTSSVATLLVSQLLPPSITSQPQPVTVHAGNNASFSVVASGALSYQWLFNGTNISSATGTSLTISNVVQTNLGTYAVVLTNGVGSVRSSNAMLSMYPFLGSPFIGVVTDWGYTNTLSVGAWGTGPLVYQWLKNGTAIANATNSTLTLTSIQFADAGLYSVVVSNPFGSVTNTPAQVVVNPAGVSLGMFPGVYVSGVVGYTYAIQASADLRNTNGWTTLATMTLMQPIQLWVDFNVNALSPANPHRYYRVIPGD